MFFLLILRKLSHVNKGPRNDWAVHVFYFWSLVVLVQLRKGVGFLISKRHLWDHCVFAIVAYTN